VRDSKRLALFTGGALGLGLAFGPVKRWWGERKAEKEAEASAAEAQALVAKITDPEEAPTVFNNLMDSADPEVQTAVNSAADLGLDLVRLAQSEGQRRGKNTQGLDQFLSMIEQQ
jgi:hypothetical protein